MSSHRILLVGWLVTSLSIAGGVMSQQPKVSSPLQGPPPKTPEEEKKTFQLAPGFQIDLVASEPQVVDPVAMAFDEDGRLFVAEMRGYPNGGVGTGEIHSGVIKVLEDRDGNGFFETSSVYADGLRLPTAVMPYRGGLLVANAPDLLFYEGAGDGKAGARRILYSGFGLDNIQQMLNGLQWGMDNWIYGCVGSSGGTVRSAEKPGAAEVVLRNRGVRFHPETPASLEPTSGGGQYGLAADDWGHWFTNTNSQHLRQIVLPDHYLRRNPYLAVDAVTLDIPDHGAACQVDRISPFEPWRVERTRRRKDDPAMRARLPATELVPGGYITSACSPAIYTADAFPAEFYNNSFICDPANNLIHRDVLEPKGSVYVAKRAGLAQEFLASTDIWFRPVCLAIGPDGALYVADFYREVIETPISLPDDMKKVLNVESRGKGRIWRVAPVGLKSNTKPRLRQAATAELLAALVQPNPWWRLTAQRLLIEKQAKDAVPGLMALVRECHLAQARAHALWTLQGLGALKEDLVLEALADADPGVRAQGLVLGEAFAKSSPAVRAKMVELVDDNSSFVRFQTALSLGAWDGADSVRALAWILLRDRDDRWTVDAALSSATNSASAILQGLCTDKVFIKNEANHSLEVLRRLAALVAARGRDSEVSSCLALGMDQADRFEDWQGTVLQGLARGFQQSGGNLRRWWEQPPEGLRGSIEALRRRINAAGAVARAEQKPIAERLAAIEVLAFGGFDAAQEALVSLLDPAQAPAIQYAAVRALSQQNMNGVAPLLLSRWAGASPAVRREMVEALTSRRDRIPILLQAIEDGKVRPADIEPLRQDQLKRYADAKISQRAQKLFQKSASADRQKIVDSYRGALMLPADAPRGKAVFKRVCASCHKIEDVGTEVGPDLLSALKTKTPETLLLDVFDPSREVDPRYVSYLVTTRNGRVFTGIIAAESANSILLRRAEKAEDTILRNQIEQIAGTAKSLMPENLEAQLSQQDFADVVAYLLRTAGVR
jgi:putative membrane-bound dehydrogenase-like protein